MLPTNGRAKGPGGKFGGFLNLIKSATRSKTKKNSSSALRSRPSKKSSGHIVVELGRNSWSVSGRLLCLVFHSKWMCNRLLLERRIICKSVQRFFCKNLLCNWTHLLSFDTQPDLNWMQQCGHNCRRNYISQTLYGPKQFGILGMFTGRSKVKKLIIQFTLCEF